ncbi:MAG: signal peptidase II [Clostridia bacterium]|nr:signal peptidase II [Clostridia bacterium]
MYQIFSGVALFLGDQIIKHNIEQKMELHEEKSILHNHVILTRYHNDGVALNILEKHKKIVAALSVGLSAFLSCLSIYLFTGRQKKVQPFMCQLAFIFLLSGAWSNTFDRVKKGFVVDYFYFNTKCKRLRNIVFNLADMFIFLGAFLLSIFRR